MSQPHSTGTARAVPVIATDGARSELLLCGPDAPEHALYWLPAMGVPARHYLPLAQALADHGIGVALHEWRGIGSSDRRAGRGGDWDYRRLLEDDLPAGLEAVAAVWPHARWSLGGHSLGGQLGCLYAGLHPARFARLVLVASGAPYWRRFRHAWLVGLAYVLAPVVARLVGYLPGRRLGFGGNEARGVVADWARSGRSGRYAVAGVDDADACMAAFRGEVLALRMGEDWLGPAASLDWLLGKLPDAHCTREVLGPEDLDTTADHFGWMKTPGTVARRIAGWMRA